MTLPNTENTLMVNVTTEPGNVPYLIINGGNDIDFESYEEYIQFNFPLGYSNLDIRVFEENEEQAKTTIMNAYGPDPAVAIQSFDQLWQGNASSSDSNREFEVYSSEGNTLIVRDKDLDGSTTGCVHSFILKFTYNNLEYLQDPRIRNLKDN